jgi:alkylation response protein AidB-like acyl-CoA dehydrogenase
MSNYFTDNDDLQFYFQRGIDWEAIASATEHGYRSKDGFSNVAEATEFYRGVAEMVGEFVADQVEPRAKAIDRAGAHLKDGEAVTCPEMDDLFEQIRGLELHGMCLPRELGGMNCPMISYLINTELFARADVSVMAHYGFHGGMALAMLMMSFMEGTTEIVDGRIEKTRFAREIEEIRAGRAWGCMDITEPDAGSDMARLKAIGEQDENGNWFVTGEKIFITSGHGKYHFVIARTEKAERPDDPLAGLQGLSMFLVPTYEEDEQGNRTRIAPVTRVEEKLGHHGSVTAALSFDRAPAYLLGKRGEGFKYMLTLMNGARLGVGFESLGLCEAAYRMAKAYAAERPSMGKTIDRHEMIADYLDEMRTEVQAIRALAMRGAVAEELSRKLHMRLRTSPPTDALERARIEREEKRHAKVARRITPLLKHFASEKAVEHARRCLQIHGGNGYMMEYGAEKLLRDALVMPIYEGTSQIQSLMAMKDTLGGIMKNPQAFVRKMAQARWRSLSAKDPLERRVAKLQLSSLSAQNHLLTRTAADKVRSLSGKPVGEWPDAFLKNWDPKRDFAYAMLHAERLTRLLTDEVVAETLFEQCLQHPERRELCERWLERCEPRSRFLHDEITGSGERLLKQLARSASTAEDGGHAAHAAE